MYVLIKDHKGLDSTGLPKTRPVVSGCSSYNVGMSELCSEVLEAVFKGMQEKVGVISSDDFLAKMHKLNAVIEQEGLMIYNPENTMHLEGTTEKVVMMVASDVVALFPSMDPRETGRICGEMVELSEISFENLDYTEMLLYIQLNREKVASLKGVEPFLPRRRKQGGKAPGMSNDQVKGPWHQNEVDPEKLLWIHKAPPQS